MLRKIKLLFLLSTLPLPSFAKVMIYRTVFGYKIGRKVRIGLSIIDVVNCEIGDNVSIGHLNIFTGTTKLHIGEHTRVGLLNIFRGGDEINIGKYCDILRMNEINSIPDPDVINPINPKFLMGDGSMIGASHKIDFTDKVEFGRRVILGGRNSSIWTHNRQKTKSVEIGDNSYLGSELRFAPGAVIPANCIVGLGSVITGKFTETNKLIAGMPAKEIKTLDEDDMFLIEQKTRPDLPEHL